MLSLVLHKKRAIELRRKGYSYREILKEIPVSKSSISLWLQNMPLSEAEKHILKKRKDGNISMGRIRAAAALHSRKEERDSVLFKESEIQFENYKSDPFFQLGLALYWAEGSKRYSSFGFANSDPEMASLMLDWMVKFLEIQRNEVALRLYAHKPYAHENCEDFWSVKLGLPLLNFKKTVYKPTGSLVKKRLGYKGCIRIELGKVRFLRKMLFWQKMLIEYYRKQR